MDCSRCQPHPRKDSMLLTPAAQELPMLENWSAYPQRHPPHHRRRQVSAVAAMQSGVEAARVPVAEVQAVAAGSPRAELTAIVGSEPEPPESVSESDSQDI